MTEHPVDTRAEALTKVKRDQGFPNTRPKDAATLILIDRSGTEPKVLMGRRHAGHKFMAGKFVFPGGRVEVTDRLAAASGTLDPNVEARLMKRMQRPSVQRARALALAAVRETYEETGLLLGTKGASYAGPWGGFVDAGVTPDLTVLHFIARAITPPRRPKRFDTRFFAADAEAIGHRVDGVVGPDTELVELVWVPVDEAKALDLPPITQVVLEELKARSAAGFGHELEVPFYQMLQGKFRREML